LVINDMFGDTESLSKITILYWRVPVVALGLGGPVQNNWGPFPM